MLIPSIAGGCDGTPILSRFSNMESENIPKRGYTAKC
jgi:hypothetical protein